MQLQISDWAMFSSILPRQARKERSVAAGGRVAKHGRVCLSTKTALFSLSVSGISGVFSRMTASRREEITKALVRHLKDLAAQLNTPGRYPSAHLRCRARVCRAPHGGGFSDAVAWRYGLNLCRCCWLIYWCCKTVLFLV